jgi:putative endonuclease
MKRQKPDDRRQVGRTGEAIACRFLREKGWEIVETNWRTRSGELDVIARYGSQLVIVEVRTTRSTRFGYGLESVDARKQQQVRKLALHYVHARGWHHLPIRFDVISVLLSEGDQPARIKHVEGAF